MQWRNTSSRYGVFSLFLHWGSALVVFGLLPGPVDARTELLRPLVPPRAGAA